MFFAAQVAVCIVLLGYFWQRQAYLQRRNLQSWDSLTVQLQRYPAESASPWIRLQSARVAMEMADYAERNGNSAMPELVDLRRDAMEMRVASVKAVFVFAQPRQAS